MKRKFEEITALGDGDYRADTICVHRGRHYQLEPCKPILLREVKDTIEIKREDLKDILDVIDSVESVPNQDEGAHCPYCGGGEVTHAFNYAIVHHLEDCKLAKALKLVNKLLKEK